MTSNIIFTLGVWLLGVVMGGGGVALLWMVHDDIREGREQD